MATRVEARTQTPENWAVLEDARDGRMFVVLQGGRNGQEATLVVPGEFADADAVNFLARKARGLVCLAMHEDLVDRLQLSLMPQTNRSRIGTAFTVSIEASDGISTGISARDRALTIGAAIHPEARPADVVSPGHVFPIRVEEAEWRRRPSGPAAAVGLCRAAGRIPAAVTCALMTADGSLATADQARSFAEEEGFRVVDADELADDFPDL